MKLRGISDEGMKRLASLKIAISPRKYFAPDERKGLIRLEEGNHGTYLIVNEDTGEDILIQTDYDFPGVASTFGWPGHEHGETDGTVDCPVCGKTADEMIGEAAKWLDDHIGDTAEDPGYFES